MSIINRQQIIALQNNPEARLDVWNPALLHFLILKLYVSSRKHLGKCALLYYDSRGHSQPQGKRKLSKKYCIHYKTKKNELAINLLDI